MRITRFYQNQPLALNHTIVLDDHATHHLRNVLRARVGDPCILFNGEGGEYSADIIEVNKRQVVAKVLAFDGVSRESNLHLHLGQGISRGERMDYAIQKAVECGVNDITPLWAVRCNVKIDAKRLEKRMAHWRGVMLHACEQSGRTAIPVLHTPQKFEDWCALIENQTHSSKFVLDHRSDTRLSDVHSEASAALLVGPEGGLTELEVERAQTHGFQSVRCGGRVLRTETAAVVACSVLQAKAGDF